jgi:pimeloyl-ACP methyl ester carboxylesterase
MKTTTSNGVLIHYRCVGEGKDIILIHGLAANYGFWHIDTLLPLARKYRVTIYDLRGHGYSGMPASGYTPVDMAEDLNHLLNHLNIPQAHLIGHSMGGVIALQYTLLYPERVWSLTIADSRLRAFQPTQCPKDWPNWAEAKKKLQELGLFIPEDEPDSGIWLLEKLASPQWQKTKNKLTVNSLFVPFNRMSGGNHSAQQWLKLLHNTTARQDLTSFTGPTKEEISTIQQPVLAIYGEKSPMLPSLKGLKDCLPNCKTAIISKVGHFCLLAKPKFFVDEVSQFLEESYPKNSVLTAVEEYKR